jgi:imidazolonepropionase-like amidohydrolase
MTVQPAESAIGGEVVLTAARVFDGTGAPAFTPGYVHIRDGRIVTAGPRAEWTHAGPDISIRDFPSSTILPGLINAHSHYASQRLEIPSSQVWQWPETLQILRAAAKAQAEMARGVTAARDLGAKGSLNIVLKRAISMGLIPGPRMVVCGQLICMTGGHGYYMGREVDGPENMRVAVREMLKLGADFIKVVASGGMNVAGPHPVFPWESHVVADTVQQELGEDEIRAAVDEASKVGRNVTAHAYGVPAISAALRAGVQGIEHGIWLDAHWADYMAEHDVSLVPTISGLSQYIAFGPKRGTAPFVIERAKRAAAAHKQSVALARAAGVRVATGTDNSGEMVLEIEELVDAGFSNADGLRAATSAAAEVLGIANETGTLVAGKWADILIVQGNPLERIADLHQVQLVLKDGHAIDRVLAREGRFDL